MIELYAITAAPAPRAAGLAAVERDGLAALYGAPSTGSSADELWRRQEMLDALMEECDLLPVRYGTVVDDGAAGDLLVERRDELLAALERVRGSVELAVRIAGAASSEEGDGATYLRIRNRLLEIHSTLTQMAREGRELAPGRGAYLVPREHVEEFVARVAAIEQANEDLSLLCTGPWPAYSFVER